MRSHGPYGLGRLAVMSAAAASLIGYSPAIFTVEAPKRASRPETKRKPSVLTTRRSRPSTVPFSSDRQIARNKRQFDAGQIRFEPQRQPAA